MARVKVFVTGGYDRTIRLWEISNGQCFRTIPFKESQVNKLALTPNKRYVLVGGNPQLKLFDLHSNNPQPLRTYVGHKNNVVDIGFCNNGTKAVSASEDCSVILWNVETQEILHSFMYGSPCTNLVIHPDEEKIFVSYLSGVIRVLSLTDYEFGFSFIPEEDVSIQSLNLNSEGNILYCTSSSGKIYAYDVREIEEKTEFELLSEWQGHDNYILSSVLSTDDKFMATTSADNTVKIWDLSTNEHIITLQGHTRWVWECCFAGDENDLLLSVSSDSTVALWDWSKGEKLKEFLGGKPISSIVYNK